MVCGSDRAGLILKERPFMLRSIKQLYGHLLGAADGEIGRVKNFYFDEHNWTVRYLVADTGIWLPGRQVLLSPHALSGAHLAGKTVRLNLTRKQIEDSPAIEWYQPVSRQFEEAYYRYYGWPSYWQDDGLWGMSRFPFSKRTTKPRLKPARGNSCSIAKTCRRAPAQHAGGEGLPPAGQRWQERPCF
jgi:hypothetical protein